jgi:hypothetical protein
MYICILLDAVLIPLITAINSVILIDNMRYTRTTSNGTKMPSFSPTSSTNIL